MQLFFILLCTFTACCPKTNPYWLLADSCQGKRDGTGLATIRYRTGSVHLRGHCEQFFLWVPWPERWRIQVEVPPSGILSLSAPRRRCRTSQLQDYQRWYAQSESIIIKTHSKTIVLQDYRFYLLVFFLSLLVFTVPRCKTIVLKDSRIFLLVFL